MKRFCVKGTQQACLNDRLANAKARTHTDLRSMETKIYRIAEMPLKDLFHDSMDLFEFERMVMDIGACVTSSTTYMEAAAIIKQYTLEYPNDQLMIGLLDHFLRPIWKMGTMVTWSNFSDYTDKNKKITINNSVLNQLNMIDFYVWIEDYIAVLDCMFPEDGYKQYYQDKVRLKEPFEMDPMVMEFVYGIINFTGGFRDKWYALLKFMIDPYYNIFKERGGDIKAFAQDSEDEYDEFDDLDIDEFNPFE